jgi:hypothetical protein
MVTEWDTGFFFSESKWNFLFPLIAGLAGKPQQANGLSRFKPLSFFPKTGKQERV